MRNPEVVKLLEIYLDIAKRHQMSHVAIAMCNYRGEGQPRDVGVCDFAGDISLEKSERETLGLLIGKLDKSIDDWSLPPRNEQLDASYVCYNVAAGPLGFDFIIWLIDQEMIRVRKRAPGPLKVGFWMGKSNRTTPDRLHWLNNVFRPALAFIGAVEDNTALYGLHKEFFVPRDISDAARLGEAVPRLQPPRRIVPVGAPITITLREAEHWPERNSNFEAWLHFANELMKRGERVIIVRDTARAQEKISCFNTYPTASLDLGERLSLYEAAKANLFVSNGPAALAHFGTRPWLQFVRPVPDGDAFIANTPWFWREKMGVEQGGQFPWSAPDQRIIWEADDYENIMGAWDKYMGTAHYEPPSMPNARLNLALTA